MGATVVAIAFTETEILQLRHLMHEEGEKHLATVLRKRLGFRERYYPEQWAFADEFEELDGVKRIANAVIRLSNDIIKLREEIQHKKVHLVAPLPRLQVFDKDATGAPNGSTSEAIADFVDG